MVLCYVRKCPIRKYGLAVCVFCFMTSSLVEICLFMFICRQDTYPEPIYLLDLKFLHLIFICNNLFLCILLTFNQAAFFIKSFRNLTVDAIPYCSNDRYHQTGEKNNIYIIPYIDHFKASFFSTQSTMQTLVVMWSERPE